MLDIDWRREGILVEKEKSIENCKEKTQKKHYRKIERRKQSKSIGGCQNWGPKWTKIDRRWGAYCAKMGQNRSVTKRNLFVGYRSETGRDLS